MHYTPFATAGQTMEPDHFTQLGPAPRAVPTEDGKFHGDNAANMASGAHCNPSPIKLAVGT